jgi:uncharacterized protein DUF2752
MSATAELVFYPAALLALLLLPAGFFDEGPPLCFSRLVFGLECPGCGLTRALMHLIHFDVKTAMEYNPLSVVALPLLLWFVAWRVKRAVSSLK